MHWRKQKRQDSKTLKLFGGYTYVSYLKGEEAGLNSRWSHKSNPYPPGRRHDEWNRGYLHGYNRRPARQYEV